MSSNFIQLFSVPPEQSNLTPFLAGAYILTYENYLLSRRFPSILIDEQHCSVYDSRYEASRATAVGAQTRHLAHRAGCG